MARYGKVRHVDFYIPHRKLWYDMVQLQHSIAYYRYDLYQLDPCVSTDHWQGTKL